MTFIDSIVINLAYDCDGIESRTNNKGEFSCQKAPVVFKVGQLILGSIDVFTSDTKVYPQDILGLERTNFIDANLIKLTRFIQSLDDDGDISVSINIPSTLSSKLTKNKNIKDLSVAELESLLGKSLLDADSAIKHLKESMGVSIDTNTTSTDVSNDSNDNTTPTDASSDSNDNTTSTDVSNDSNDNTTSTDASSDSNTTPINLNPLQSISIYPNKIKLRMNQMLNFEIEGIYKDESKKILTTGIDYNIGDSSIFSIENNRIKGLSIGTTTLRASVGGINSNIIDVVVVKALDTSNFKFDNFGTQYINQIPLDVKYLTKINVIFQSKSI